MVAPPARWQATHHQDTDNATLVRILPSATMKPPG